MAIVADSSVIVGLAFEDEVAAYAQRAIDAIAADEGVVPTLFWYEVRNAMIMGERRKRLTPERSTAFLADLALLPLSVDVQPREQIVLDLARRFGLTVYDAVYLELAQRKSVPLATLDRALAVAARGCGVRVFNDPESA